MRQIGEAIKDVINSTPQSIQASDKKDELTRDIFDKGMIYLEASKQENFAPETLTTWWMEMKRRDFTASDFRRRVFAVIANVTYGKVKFEDFLLSENLYTDEEVSRLVEQRINQRADRLRELKIDEYEIAKRGLKQVQVYWSQKIYEAVEKHAERIDKKCRRLRAQFYHLPDQAKIDLWTKAVQKGIAKDGDPHVNLVLPQLVPYMMEEFEEIIKNNSGEKK